MLKEIIIAISTSGIAIAALAWLAKKIVSHFLSKDIEAYKVKLEAESEVEIEKLRVISKNILADTEFSTIAGKRGFLKNLQSLFQ